jgi:hypothetical protein
MPDRIPVWQRPKPARRFRPILKQPWIAILCVGVAYMLWHWRGPLVDSMSDVSSLVIAIVGILFAMMPSRAAELERYRRWRYGVGFTITLIGITGLVSNYYDKKATRQTLQQLVAASSGQATTQDVNSLRTEIRELRKDTQVGFQSVVEAINGLRSGSKSAPPPKPPPVTQSPPVVAPVEPSISLGPSIVQHIRASQKRVTSSRDDAPFAIQLTLQSDVPSQPTAFMIECSGPIEEGKFFIAGQGVMMGVAYGVQPDRRHFYFRFQYPPFTPESPIVVTLLSKEDIRVVSIARAN